MEWAMPDLIVVDGGIAQLNVAKKIISRFTQEIETVSVVKDDRHKAKAILGNPGTVSRYKREILLANSEAHRFAIKFYRQKSRRKMFE